MLVSEIYHLERGHIKVIPSYRLTVPTELITELDDTPLAEISPPNLQVIAAFLLIENGVLASRNF
jgi:hypothetical protein